MAKHNHKQDSETATADNDAGETGNDTAYVVETGNAPKAGFKSLEIAGITVELPVRFTAGHVLTDNEAKTLDAAYRRQFRNNQDANAKARAAKNEAPLTADELVKLYLDYQPAVEREGNGNAVSDLDRAAWDAWLAAIIEHNASIESGGKPVLKSNVVIQLPKAPRKTKGTDDAAHEKAVAEFNAYKAGIVAKLQATPAYAERIKHHLALNAAMAGKKPKDEDKQVVAASGDLI